MSKDSAIYTLIADVETAIRKYDLSNDHTRHLPASPDCIRCKLAEALPHYVGDRRGPEKRKET